MKVLITGGAGFLGQHLAASLLKKGHCIEVLDDLSTSKNVFSINTNQNLSFIQGSILDQQLVSTLIQRAELVIHLAAIVGVSNVMNSPLRGLQTNVLGSELIIRTCYANSVPIVLTSSSEIYGKNDSGPLSELSDRVIGVPQISRWSYSDSKAIEEAFALAYFKEKNLSVKIVRLFNTVGPGQRSEFGMVLPSFIESAMSHQDIIVHGTGLQKRCFMHVIDAVSGITKVIESDKAIGSVYNLGNPSEITILDLAKKVKEISHSKSKIVFRSHKDVYGEDFQDMDSRFPDITKAESELGWKPFKSLDEIIQESIDFYNQA